MAASTTEFEVLPCTPEDVPAMVEIYIAAFKDNYMNQIWMPSETVTHAAQQDWLRPRFSKLFSKPETIIMKAIDPLSGDMAAWIRWNRPYEFTESEKSAREREGASEGWPEGAVVEACEQFFGALGAMKKKWVNEKQDYVCQLLAVSPTYQRRGLGALLLRRSGLDRADAEGKRAYIEATHAGHALYKKLGWKDVDLIELDMSKWGGEKPGLNWIMIREPREVKSVVAV